MSFGASPSLKGISELVGLAPPHSMSELYRMKTYASQPRPVPREGPINFGVFQNTAPLLGVGQTRLYPLETLAPSDQFGRSVSISGAGVYAIVGAPGDDSTTGAAYIFTRVAGIWSQQVKLTASDASFSSSFGTAVAMSGDGTYVIIGAPGDDVGSGDSGAVYIFNRSGSTWTQQVRFKASDAVTNQILGMSVAISWDGAYAIAGAYGDNSFAGAVYILTRSGTAWSLQQKIPSPDPGSFDSFGIGVSISGSGDTAIVGSYGDDDIASNAGAVYIFVRSGTTWSQQAKFSGSDTAISDYFGRSVSISRDGSQVIVGATGHDAGGLQSAGAVYAFSREGTTWSQLSKIVSPEPATSHYFGWSVGYAGAGRYASIGVLNANAIFTKYRSYSTGFGTPTLTDKKVAWDQANNDYFGSSVAMDELGYNTIVGAYNKDTQTGAAYIVGESFFLN
jgi:hypothetical protein